MSFFKGLFENRKGLEVIIVGLPRSGTSFLTSIVQHLSGLHLGDSGMLRQSDSNNKYGYFEYVPLMKVTDKMLTKLGGNFHNLPDLNPEWKRTLVDEQEEIIRIVRKDKIQLYKDNRLMVIPDIYYDLFPAAKWIFIERDVNETYQSRFGIPISFEDWVKVTNRRLEYWKTSEAAKNALSLDYQDFKEDFDTTLNRIIDFLNIEIDQSKIESCHELFKPTNK